MNPFKLTEQRTRGNTCVRCRALFAVGDRVTTALIVVGTKNLTPRDVLDGGIHLNADEFEMCHIDCHDPSLSIPVLKA